MSAGFESGGAVFGLPGAIQSIGNLLQFRQKSTVARMIDINKEEEVSADCLERVRL